MNRQHAGNGFSTWRLGIVEAFESWACAEVVDDEGVQVARVFGKDAAEARQRACIVAISPEMYRALGGAAACLERFLLPPEELATAQPKEPAK